MRLSKAGYYADFIVYPFLILALLGSRLVLYARQGDGVAQGFVHQDLVHQGLARQALVFAGLCLAGAATWTLFEYVLHRYVLHRVPILHDMHEAHHADPGAYVGTPSWASLLFFILLAFLPLARGFGVAVAIPFTAGLAFGYLCYVGVHHVSHHWRLAPGTYLYRLRHRHARHHFAKTPGNFGVTTLFWDKVFGTSLEAARRSGQ